VNGVTCTAGLTVNPTSVTIKDVTCAPTSILCGNTAVGKVDLSGKAPAGGVSIALTPTSGAAYTSGTVTVPEGEKSATFTIYTSVVTSDTAVTITASLGNSASTTIIVEAPQLTNLTLSPASVDGGDMSTGTVKIAKALSFDYAVPLNSIPPRPPCQRR